MNSDPVFVEVLQRRLKDFSMQHEEYIWGYIEEHGYPKLLNELKTLGYSYSIRKSTLNKGKNAVTFSFKSSDPSDAHFFASPFISLKRITLQCILGPNHRQVKEECETSDHPTVQKKRMHITNTKKMGCPATILVRSIEVFSKYVVDKNSSQDVKREVLQTLRSELNSESPPKGQIWYYLKVMGNHTHEPTIAEMHDRIHPLLVAEIYKLVNSGVASTRDIEIYLRSFVENVTENKPKYHNKAFYPSKNIIYFHVNKALSQIRDSKCDQEALDQVIESRKKDSEDDSFCFRPLPCVSILESSDMQQSQLLQAQRRLRENMKYICDISYMCNDLDLLNSCIGKSHAIGLEMTKKLPSSSGLPLLPEVVKGKSSTKHNHKPFPPRKKCKKDGFN